jgi:Ca-activated chloride channel family protein
VILATDGDFNVGVSSDGDLTRMIEEKRGEGIFLTVLGFGTGNYKDSKMEKLADKGNGNYYYIDTLNEARKVLVSELGSMLIPVAKDVKVQVEFNPSAVKAYRLIGYENRALAKEDFNDDTKDAGELGAGHTVTAFYEIVPAGSPEEHRKTDPLQYMETVVRESADLMTVKLRYKELQHNTSQLIAQKVSAGQLRDPEEVSDNFRFGSTVVEFGLLLKDSAFKGQASYLNVLQRAKVSLKSDAWGYRQEFIRLVEKAAVLDRGY